MFPKPSPTVRFNPFATIGPPALPPKTVNISDPGWKPTCIEASFFAALYISFTKAYVKPTVKLGLPSGIGPVGIPNLLRSLTMFAVDCMADKPGLLIIEHTNNNLDNCGNGGLTLSNKFDIVLHI